MGTGYTRSIEVQVLDNVDATDNKVASHLAGSLYDMIAADPKTVKKEVATRLMFDPDLRIPPRAAEHRVEQTWAVSRDVLLLSLFPHMHQLGVEFEQMYDSERRRWLQEKMETAAPAPDETQKASILERLIVQHRHGNPHHLVDGLPWRAHFVDRAQPARHYVGKDRAAAGRPRSPRAPPGRCTCCRS